MNPKCKHILQFTGEMLAKHYIYKCQTCGASIWAKNPPGADGSPDFSKAFCPHPHDKLEPVRVELRPGPCGKKLPRTIFRCTECGAEGTTKDLT
jgi:hypothetical protein